MKTLTVLVIFAATALCVAADPAFTIDGSHPVGKVSPTFFGLMTEEINHSYGRPLRGTDSQPRLSQQRCDAG